MKNRKSSVLLLLVLIGAIPIFCGVIFAYVCWEDYTRLTAIPTVPISQLLDHLGQEVRIEGRLRTIDGPVEGRDGKHKFGLQLVNLKWIGRKTSQTAYTGWAPTRVLIDDGSNKLTVRICELYRQYMTYQGNTYMGPNWKDKPVGQVTSAEFDEDLKPHETHKDDCLEVWTLNEGEPVAVIGIPTNEPGTGLVLKAKSSILWISNKPQAEMMRQLTNFALITAAVFAVGVAFEVAAWIQFKKGYSSGAPQ